MFKREEFAVVLDFLPYGRSKEASKEPLAQAIGEQFFTLLELVIKPQASIAIGDRIYIGKGVRDKVEYIKSRIEFNQLTSAAQRELEGIIRRVVISREQEYVNFFNHAGSISIRTHSLELLPSIGKKHLQAILSEREKKPLSSFEDIQQRIPHLGSVEDIIVQRILEELRGESKYYLFLRAPAPHEERE